MTLFALDGHRPTLPDDGSAWVAHDANLIGKVVVGRDASIWFGVTIRGDNEEITVGEGTNVQENTVMHTDIGFPLTIGRNCTIGHKAMLHGCTIGDESLIGMGAIVLNGARIGRNCLIGAGSLIPEHKIIPDGSLVVGAPGKIIRTLDETAIEGLRNSALHYQQKARLYREGLKPVP